MTSTLESTVVVLLMLSTRTSAMVIFAPVLGHTALPSTVKAGIVIAITVLLYPVTSVPVMPNGVMEWTRCLCGEAIVGTAIGLVVNLVLDGALLAGQIVGSQVGFSMAEIIDPQSQVNISVFSVFHQLLTSLIFLQLDVHCWLIRGLARSFGYLPIGHTLSAASALVLCKSIAGVWVIGVEIAAPVVVATVAADLTLGFLSKASPQFPVMLFGISCKTLLGILALSAGLRYWPPLFEKYFGVALSRSEQLLQLAR